MSSSSRQEPWIDWGKALASQLIVWHHITFYGPLAAAASVLAEDLLAWLADDARIAVQVFLVMSGYLAARSLLQRPGHVVRPPRGAALGQWVQLVFQRYQRLMRPGAIALALAIAAAALARHLITDPDTPAAPQPEQLLANLLLLHDWLGYEALSAGLWYVAIDWQLYACFAALACWHSRSRLNKVVRRRVAITVVLGAAVASVLWINRQPEWDMAAPYFFGAYGLGVLAGWLRDATPTTRRLGVLLLACLLTLALWVEWRERLLVAGLTTLVLVYQPGAQWLIRQRLHTLMHWLAGLSYPVFLLHYGVFLVVSALIHLAWPGQAHLNALGLVLAWLASLGLAWLLNPWMNGPGPRVRDIPMRTSPSSSRF